MSTSLLSALFPQILALNPFTDDFNDHHSSWDSHTQEDQSGKDLFDWLLLIFYLLATPNITPYYTAPLKTAPPLISLWFLAT